MADGQRVTMIFLHQKKRVKTYQCLLLGLCSSELMSPAIFLICDTTCRNTALASALHLSLEEEYCKKF